MRTRTPVHVQPPCMANREGTDPASPLVEFTEGIHREHVRRVAALDHDANRDTDDVLETE